MPKPGSASEAADQRKKRAELLQTTKIVEKSVRADEPFHDPQLDVQDQAVTVASTESRLPPAVHKSLPELGSAFPGAFIAILRPNELDRPDERKEGVKRKWWNLNSLSLSKRIRSTINSDREESNPSIRVRLILTACQKQPLSNQALRHFQKPRSRL